jgi:ligand-binding sensor domain-containing protein
VRFVRWAPRTGPRLPSEDIRSLAAYGDELWIGTAAGISSLTGQKLINHGIPAQLNTSGIRTVILDPAAGVWGGSSGSLGGGLVVLRPHSDDAISVSQAYTGAGVNASVPWTACP